VPHGWSIPVCPGDGGPGVEAAGALMCEISAALRGWGDGESFHGNLQRRQPLFWILFVTTGLTESLDGQYS
jgi:hypothetical protein